jgi:hypothetical protein
MSNASTAAAATAMTTRSQVSEDVEWVAGTVVVVVEVDVVVGTVVVGRETGVDRVVGGLVVLVVVVVGAPVVVVAGMLVVVVGSVEAHDGDEYAAMSRAAARATPPRTGTRRPGRRAVAGGHDGRAPCWDAQITSSHLSQPRCPSAMLTAASAATGVTEEVLLESERVGPNGPTLSRNPPGCSLGPRARWRIPRSTGPFAATELSAPWPRCLTP